MATRQAPNFGSSWSCVSDLTMPSIMATGFRIVAEAIARRWMTPRGFLISDPNYGFDLTGMIGDDIDVAKLAQLGQGATAEALKDERVKSCTLQLTFVDGTLTVRALVNTNQGPFRFVASVSSVRVSLLEVLAA